MSANDEPRGSGVFRTVIGAVAVVVLVVIGARLFSPSSGGMMPDSFLNASHDAAFAKAAVRFADALVREDFQAAHDMLSPGLRSELSTEALRDRYEAMIEYGDGPATAAMLITTMEDWPDRQSQDAGWAYVSIEGPEFMEGVTVIVERTGDALTIRDIEWGRP